MNATFHAELIKLRRPRILAAALGLSVLFAVGTALAVVLPAEAGDRELTGAGGLTQAFSAGLAFTGILVFVTLIANVSAEFSQGTFRTLLMREPRRLALLAGKLAALLAFAAALLTIIFVLCALASTAIAAAQGLPTNGWFGTAGLSAGLDDLARVAVSWGAWAILGTALAVLLRSAPIALGIGIAWSGPLEHVVQNAWQGAGDWFPGLLLEGFAGTVGLDARAGILLTLYVVLAAAAAAFAFQRRDVTA